MNESKIAEKDKQKSKKKNIREVYLNAVKHNKGFFPYSTKKSLSNTSFNASSASLYLEKEYSLVKRIINDTKELKHIKTKGEISNGSSEKPLTRPSTANGYKSPEEYSREILELKKALKNYENDEVVNKAKFEYYDNELSKKEQEIIDLLENKKIEELRNSDSKSELIATIYSLKQKSYKLEFSLKRKENELNKLKNELKTTNMKDLKAQNERLRQELSKALMNDKKIIEAFEKEGVIERNGYSYYDSERRKNESEISLHKKEKLKESIAQQLAEDGLEDENQFRTALKDFKRKMPLKGTLKQKLEILDLRENECLKEIERLNERIEKEKIDEKLKRSESVSSLHKGSVVDHVSRRDDSLSRHEDKRTRSVEKLQSVLRGHLERVNSLNRKQHRDGDMSSSGSLHGRDDESVKRRTSRNRRSPSPPIEDEKRRRRPPPHHRRRDSESSSDASASARSDSKQNLIEDKNVSEVETKGGCCGRFKSSKK